MLLNFVIKITGSINNSHYDAFCVSSPGAGDLTGDPFGYITGVLAVIIHASYLVLIQKTSLDSEYGPLTAQYAIAIMASPVRTRLCVFV